MALRPEEREILQRVVAAGGQYCIHGLPLREMMRAADVVLDLQRARLVVTTVFFGAELVSVPVVITEAGRRALKDSVAAK